MRTEYNAINTRTNWHPWLNPIGCDKQYAYSAPLDLRSLVPLDANAMLDAAAQGATVNEPQGWIQNANQAGI